METAKKLIFITFLILSIQSKINVEAQGSAFDFLFNYLNLTSTTLTPTTTTKATQTTQDNLDLVSQMMSILGLTTSTISPSSSLPPTTLSTGSITTKATVSLFELMKRIRDLLDSLKTTTTQLFTTSTTVSSTTEVPTTEVPTTEVPTTEVPTTEVPTTEVPTTEVPTTEVPTTEAPTTEMPTTEDPTTTIEAPPADCTKLLDLLTEVQKLRLQLENITETNKLSATEADKRATDFANKAQLAIDVGEKTYLTLTSEGYKNLASKLRFEIAKSEAKLDQLKIFEGEVQTVVDGKCSAVTPEPTYAPPTVPGTYNCESFLDQVAMGSQNLDNLINSVDEALTGFKSQFDGLLPSFFPVNLPTGVPTLPSIPTEIPTVPTFPIFLAK